jgi:hypothetical protein
MPNVAGVRALRELGKIRGLAMMQIIIQRLDRS